MPKKSQINEYSDNSEGIGILTLQTSKGVVPSRPVVFNPPRDGNMRTLNQ
jgi:hypothetical protein